MMSDDPACSSMSLALRRLDDRPESFAILDRFLDRYLHRVRNRLNTVRLALFLSRRFLGGAADSLAEIDSAYKDLERFVDHFQRLTRPLTITPVATSLSLFLDHRVAVWRRMLGANSPTIEFLAPVDDVVASIDADRLGQALDAFVVDRLERLGRGAALVLTLRENGPSSTLSGEETPADLGSSPDLPREHRAFNLTTVWLERILSHHGAVLIRPEQTERSWAISWPRGARTGQATT